MYSPFCSKVSHTRVMNFDKTIFEDATSVEKAYAISQLDPFHDMPYRLEGAPSDGCASSVVMVVNQEKTLACTDFGISPAVGAKWDLHITNIPMLQPASFYPCQLKESCLLWNGNQSSDVIQTLYPISACGVPIGNPTFVGGTGSVVGVNTTVPYYISNETAPISIPRCMRLIGLSYEVVDETPKFYQQGAVTVYNRPSSLNVANYSVDIDQGSASVQQNHSCTSCASPLNRISQATIIPSSKTWKSSEGVYVVCRRNGSDNPFQRPSLTNLFLYGPQDPIDATLKTSYVPREAVYAQQNPIDPVNADSFNSIVPYNLTGSYFTGLSCQYATLRLRTKFIYEILPDPMDSSLIPLATDTVPRNSDFETTLDRLIMSLPYGVPQTMNPKGEFWGMILKSAKKAGRTLSRVASNPITQAAVGSLAGPGTLAALNTANSLVQNSGVLRDNQNRNRARPSKKKQPQATAK